MKRVINDLFLIGGILLLAGISLIIFGLTSVKNDLEAYVYHDSDVILVINLEDDSYHIYDDMVTKEEDGFHVFSETEMIIRAENKEVWVESSGCKDKICVKTGHLTSSGEVACCLPNKVSVTLKKKSGVDVSV